MQGRLTTTTGLSFRAQRGIPAPAARTSPFALKPETRHLQPCHREKYQWFKRTLETSSAPYKFVFAHHVNGTGRGGVELAGTYEWGDAAQFATQRPGWGQPIHQLLVEHHVSAVFHGHDHVFVQQELDGIVYQEVPQPSTTDANPRIAADYGYTHGTVLGSSGHLRVTVTPAQVTVAYMRAYLPQDEMPTQQNGQVAYSYTIAR